MLCSSEDALLAPSLSDRLQEGSEAAPAFGAARLARRAATGEDPSAVCTKPAVAAEIAPDPALTAEYAERLTQFRALYRAVAPLF